MTGFWETPPAVAGMAEGGRLKPEVVDRGRSGLAAARDALQAAHAATHDALAAASDPAELEELRQQIEALAAATQEDQP